MQHSPRGIHAQKDSANAWEWMAQDGLGSVRSVVDSTANLLWSTNYDPYGTGFGVLGTPQTPYGFTGEPTLPGGLVHLRARNYNSALGIFTALDPFEGSTDRAMSLNGYLWVEGNTPNMIDPSGAIYESPNRWASCAAKGLGTENQIIPGAICSFFKDTNDAIGIGTYTGSQVAGGLVEAASPVVRSFARFAVTAADSISAFTGFVTAQCYAQEGDTARAVWNTGLTVAGIASLVFSAPVVGTGAFALGIFDMFVQAVQQGSAGINLNPPFLPPNCYPYTTFGTDLVFDVDDQLDQLNVLYTTPDFCSGGGCSRRVNRSLTQQLLMSGWNLDPINLQNYRGILNAIRTTGESAGLNVSDRQRGDGSYVGFMLLAGMMEYHSLGDNTIDAFREALHWYYYNGASILPFYENSILPNLRSSRWRDMPTC